MADPLSLTLTCACLAKLVVVTANEVTLFVRDCREARLHFVGISGYLAELQTTLELLSEDGNYESVPPHIQDSITTHIRSFQGCIESIGAVLRQHRGKRGAAFWAMDGKKEVEGLKRELEAYKSSLSLAVDTINL